MEAMVVFAKDDMNFFYSIQDIENFSNEVRSHLKGISMKNLELEKLPAHSLKVNRSMSFQDLMVLSHKYGRPIYKSQYQKRLGEGGWYTQPSLMTSMMKALIPADAEVPESMSESYTIATRPRKTFMIKARSAYNKLLECFKI